MRVMDSSLNDLTAAQFKAAMSGVMLNYALATPIEYDLVDEIQTASRVADFGTEEAVPAGEVDTNGVPKSAPFRAIIAYNGDFTREIANLPKNYIGKDSMEHILSALQTAGIIGSYTLTYDSENGRFACTVTAPSE